MRLKNILSGNWCDRIPNPPKQSKQAASGNKQASMLAIAGSFVLAIATPLMALEVEVNPRDPQLGDTLLVEIELDPGEAEPTGVSMSEETYPVFPISGNKYRALVPTTPLLSLIHI